MSWKEIIVASVVMIGAAASSGARRPPSHSVLRVALTEPRKDVEALRAQGYDVIVVAHDRSWADVVAHGDEPRTALRLLGFETLREEAVDGHYGVDSGYHTPEEVESELKDYAQRYPDLVTLRSIGKSGEGRDIWAVKLTSDNYAQLATKPVVLFNAMHHAREVMSTEIALDTLEYLLTRFNQDPKVTHWLAENEIWILPMLNVDGNSMVWHSDNMWRKNTTGGYGVDINRNYPPISQLMGTPAWNTCNGSIGNRGAESAA